MLENLELFAKQRSFEAIWEAHDEVFFDSSRSACHDRDGSARMDDRVIRRPHLVEDHDLSARGHVVSNLRHLACSERNEVVHL